MNARFLISLCVLAVLTGCGTVQKEYVTKTELQVIETPKKFLEPCPVSKPVPIKEYLAKTPSQREEALTELTVNLYKDLKICNDQIAEIKGFQERQLKIVEDAKAKK